ncbi:hypothetical protein SLEP1_g50278 [Rubroshorea leprosula]|uniref:Uncharacterized protein n=1 Tax=Rubroshorea leprosula TaxID=152421 RepID=A0AAV5LZH5_9ROSI|nr:hypothetical protein SLEP1_g50278 [Rubroshorea leprosula]
MVVLLSVLLQRKEAAVMGKRGVPKPCDEYPNFLDSLLWRSKGNRWSGRKRKKENDENGGRERKEGEGRKRKKGGISKEEARKSSGQPW